MKSLFAAGALIFAAALPALSHGEPSWRDFKGVANTSFVEPGGDRAIQLSIDVAASPQAVFDAFTTSEGYTSWATPVAHVNLRIGGIIETSYDAAARIGDPGNIKNEIIAYLPGRLLVIRNVQAPADFADPRLFGHTVTIIELAPIAGGGTRVTLTNAGYGPGEAYKTLYGHFEWGDAYSLAELRKRFERGPVDWAAQAAKEKVRRAARRVEGAATR